MQVNFCFARRRHIGLISWLVEREREAKMRVTSETHFKNSYKGEVCNYLEIMDTLGGPRIIFVHAAVRIYIERVKTQSPWRFIVLYELYTPFFLYPSSFFGILVRLFDLKCLLCELDISRRLSQYILMS